LFQANVSNYKQQLADKLVIETGQPGSIHFGLETRGFDQEFFLQLLSEHKETKLSRVVRTVVWKRIRDRNEGLDLVVMILCLLDVYRTQIDQMSGPLVVQANDSTTDEQSEPARPKWGVISRTPLPADTNGWRSAPFGPRTNRRRVGVHRIRRFNGNVCTR
jgi:phage terminase large subunit GpA-like protein